MENVKLAHLFSVFKASKEELTSKELFNTINELYPDDFSTIKYMQSYINSHLTGYYSSLLDHRVDITCKKSRNYYKLVPKDTQYGISVPVYNIVKDKNLLIITTVEDSKISYDFNTKKVKIEGVSDRNRNQLRLINGLDPVNLFDRISNAEWLINYIPELKASEIISLVQFQAQNPDAKYIPGFKEYIEKVVAEGTYQDIYCEYDKYKEIYHKQQIEKEYGFFGKNMLKAFPNQFEAWAKVIPVTLLRKMIMASARDGILENSTTISTLYNLINKFDKEFVGSMLDDNRPLSANIEIAKEYIKNLGYSIEYPLYNIFKDLDGTEFEGYQIKIPKMYSDIEQEAKGQNNCVRSYSSDYANKSYMLVFIRRPQCPDIPFITVGFNVRSTTLTSSQALGINNRRLDSYENSIVSKLLIKFNEIYEKSI